MAGVVSPYESWATELGLNSAGKAAVCQPEIHNILGRTHLFFSKISATAEVVHLRGMGREARGT